MSSRSRLDIFVLIVAPGLAVVAPLAILVVVSFMTDRRRIQDGRKLDRRFAVEHLHRPIPVIASGGLDGLIPLYAPGSCARQEQELEFCSFRPLALT